MKEICFPNTDYYTLRAVIDLRLEISILVFFLQNFGILLLIERFHHRTSLVSPIVLFSFVWSRKNGGLTKTH